MQESTPILKTENLCFTYGAGTPFEKTALRDVSLDIFPGEILGIIGHTGSGKSTLIQHLNGLLKPSSGKAILNGKDIWADKKQIRAVRFAVGLVFQYPEYQLFEETVEKDIAYGPKNMGLSEKDVDERVRSAADIVGLKPELLKKSPFELSGGEKRRAAIAGVIAMRPQVLILDEPTAGLDPHGRDSILRRLKAYQTQSGTAMLFVSHSMEDVARMADRVLVMQNGSVAMIDVPENIYSRTDELAEMGLSVPQITQIFTRLNELGLRVPRGVFTMDSGERILLSLLKGGAV